MTDSGPLAVLASNKFVRLTTFRRDGTPVPTPVGVVRDGDRLLVITDASTGKVKRVRHTPRVLIAPCGPGGRVKPGVADIEATVEIIEDRAEVQRLDALFRARYGFMYPIAMFFQKLRGLSNEKGVALRITF